MEHGWPLISEDERERAARFYMDVHRSFFLSGRAMVRRILARYVAEAAAEIRFVQGEFGKPSLASNGAGVEFNVSHSGDLLLIAVSTRPVGVDVERWKETSDLLELADHFFSPTEREHLRALPRDGIVAGFFAAWCRKEAYLKASGTGISGGLDHFSMSLTPGEPARILHDDRDPGVHQRWFVTVLDVGTGYSAALVAEQPVDDVLLFDLSA